MRGLKIHVVVLAFVITLGAALGGAYFVYHQRVADPLLAKIEGVSGIAEAHLEQAGSKKDLVLRVQGSADLIAAYMKAEELAVSTLGDNLGRIKVEDDRDAHLSQAFYKMHFHVQQGIATGLFADMEEHIDQIAETEGLEAHKVMVTSDRVFVALRDDDKNLLETIVRTPMVAEVPSTARRSVTLW